MTDKTSTRLTRIEELEEKEKYLKILNAFALSLMTKHTVSEITWDVVRSVIVHMGFEDCVVYIVDKSRTHLIQHAAHGPKNPRDQLIKDPIKIAKGSGIVGSVAETGIAEIIGDTTLDPRYIVDDERRYSEITVPIILEGELIGVIDSEHSQRGYFNQNHLDILTTVSTMVADKIKRAWLEKELRQYQNNLERTVVERTNQLEESMIALKEINHDLLSFSYATSHDLKEPLRMIVSFLQLIQLREKSLSQESIDNLNLVLSNAFRMQRLLNELLDYSKVNFQTEDRKEVAFTQIISTAQKNLSLMVDNSQTELVVADDIPNIYGHELLLIQLFQNLLSNAIKFKQKALTPVIKINYLEHPDYHVFTISDNGIGIPQQFRTQVFNLFQRLESRSEESGSGIGLAFCKRIIDKHEGYIKIIDSPDNIGTTFEFGLAKES